MKLNWFTRKGIIYRPASIMGWVILVAAVLFAVYVFININSQERSGSDVMINFVFQLLFIGLVYTVIAYFTEKSWKQRDYDEVIFMSTDGETLTIIWLTSYHTPEIEKWRFEQAVERTKMRRPDLLGE